jgi:hypothetical protein
MVAVTAPTPPRLLALTAGAFGFFDLIRYLERPELYRDSDPEVLGKVRVTTRAARAKFVLLSGTAAGGRQTVPD